MVSPCKTVHSKNKNEATKAISLLEKYNFYLDIKNSNTSRIIESQIKKFGGRVEVFLVQSVTHVVTDRPKCDIATTNGNGFLSARESPFAASHSASPNPDKGQVAGRGGGSCSWSRADAMLERVRCLPQRQTHLNDIIQQAQLWNIPVLTLQKVKEFLGKVCAVAYKRIDSEDKIFKGAYIKFESIDRKSRAVFKEFPVWPGINLTGDHTGSPFMPPEGTSIKGEKNRRQSKAKNKNNLKGGNGPIVLNNNTAGQSSATNKTRMTRKPKPRTKERVDILPKQGGYCEICRVDYIILSEHERSEAHVNFVKNCSNFLSLDTLIGAAADVDTFLKTNRPIEIVPEERRSLRNVKVESETPSDSRKQLKIICNGGIETGAGLQMSPALSERGHYLRSKGAASVEQEYPPKASPKESCRRDAVRNGSVSPRVDCSRFNGKIEDGTTHRGKRPRAIRWQRPSPDAPRPVPDHPYYKVVGMSTKLRSSNSFAPKDCGLNAALGDRTTCNGDSASGLVVKFRRVRRSELSVLSDEAENFMFPKRDDSDTEEDSDSGAPSPHFNSNGGSQRCRSGEENQSGDDASQDGYGSDCGRKNSRKRPPSDLRLGLRSDSIPPDEKEKTETPADPEVLLPIEKCLKWEDGRLKASPRVENLTYTFERIPESEPWYDTFTRQDRGKMMSKSVTEYLGYYRKPPILPYEMGELPPLKPDCCILGRMSKAGSEPGPLRPYGTRGMKKRKIKLEPVVVPDGKNSRKSPREHASTLAILGGLGYRKRSKLSGSEDSKSLPSIAEEDASSDAPLVPKMPLDVIADMSERLRLLLSSVYDDAEEYDAPMDEEVVKFGRTASSPDVVKLLETYENCRTIEDAAAEIRDSGPKRRGCKFKKKNKTGWPSKKKIKRETVSASTSREASPRRIIGSPQAPFSPPDVDSDCATEATDGGAASSTDGPSASRATDTEGSENGDDENFLNNVNVDLKQWECAERTLSDRLSVEREATVTVDLKSVDTSHSGIDLQPVVRVQKMDRASLEAEGGRRLRSSGSRRQLRARWRSRR